MLEMIHMSHVSSDRVMPSCNVHHQAITPFEKPPASSLAHSSAPCVLTTL